MKKTGLQFQSHFYLKRIHRNKIKCRITQDTTARKIQDKSKSMKTEECETLLV